MIRPSIIAVLPILPSLLGLFAIVPALLAGLLAAARALLPTKHTRANEGNEWLRFWVRQTPSFLVIASLVLGARWWWSHRPLVPVALPRAEGIPSQERWPTLRGDQRRSGIHPASSLPTAGPLEVLWRFQPPGQAFYADPTPHGDRLYLVGSQGDVGTIYAISRSDGTLAWSCRPPHYCATVSSPVVVDNILYVGEGLHHVRNGRVIAIAVAGPRTGQVLWTFRVRGHLECTPLIVDQKLLIAAGDDGVYCLQLAEHGAEPAVLWHTPGQQIPDCDMALAVSGGSAYVGTGGDRPGVVVLDIESGRELDYWPTPTPVRGSPCIAEPRILFATAAGNLTTPQSQAGRIIVRSLLDITPVSNRVDTGMRYEIATTADVLGPLAADEAGFACGSADGWVRCYDVQGRLAASWFSGAAITGAPVLSDGVLVVHNRAGMLFGLDRQTLRTLWSIPFAPAGDLISSPVAADGRIFIGTDEDGVLCLGQK